MGVMDLDDKIIANELWFKERVFGEYGLDSFGLLLESVAIPS
jgi:hypothetical protein